MVPYMHPKGEFNPHGEYMYTYPTTQQITRKTVTTTKTYDGEGRLVTEETYEEIEYAPAPSVLPQPGISPNTPWIVTNAADTGFHGYDHYGDAHRSVPLDLDSPVEVG